ncbi:MAG: hypothetical protein QOE06_2649 [Thermoleophilaceae bacterium]|jgi:hypothetical protein|nr:hypothetical protein [Thermoleophilaceae bacterium]
MPAADYPPGGVTSLFCRHNRFTADCSICSKDTVLDPSRDPGRPRPRRSASGPGKRRAEKPGSRQFSGPHVSVGPYERDDADAYEVRLEKVPGGVRLAQWSRGSLERRAPELPGEDVAGLVAAALEKDWIEPRDRERLEAALAAPNGGDPAEYGASAGRAGDMREELRVERLGDGRVRVGRWLFWPGRGWELQEAPPMFPAARYAEALREARAGGVLAAAP